MVLLNTYFLSDVNSHNFLDQLSIYIKSMENLQVWVVHGSMTKGTGLRWN